METRTACVIVGAAPEDVDPGPASIVRANRLGALVTGKPGDRVIDYAEQFAGPVYDVMYNARTGWFAVTIYSDLDQPQRWDNRPDADAGYPRVDHVLGGQTPTDILAALDIDPALLGYSVA